jgi:hypothetical protein
MRWRLQLLLVAHLLMGSALVAAGPPECHKHSDEPIAHPHDPVLQAEHMDLLSLVPPAAATHTAVSDGQWSDVATWKDGKLPTADANVLIPHGTTVTVDEVLSMAVRTVRVDGKLELAPNRDTCLVVDTLVVAPGGELIIGTVKVPIAPDKRARIVFADRGPIDVRWDPNLLSRGLLAHGVVSIVGAEVTSYLPVARSPRKGDTRLALAQAPVNWKKGDRLVLTGTTMPDKNGRTQDEELTIVDVRGAEVTVPPLQFDHTVPKPGLAAYVGNLTRNVRLESQNRSPEELGRHGHVMFMHSPRVTISYCGLYDLGRTDKRIPVNDPRLNEHKRLIAGTGTNARGRYSLHFHRTGADLRTPAIPVKGCAVVNSPGWGYVNHSSHVAMEENVAYNVHGAAFVTEAGDEVGSFRRNLTVRSAGSGQDTVARNDLQDFGHEGSGFWLQGGGVAVEDNIAAGHRDAAYFFFTSGLVEEGLGRRGFLVANVPARLRGNNVPSPKDKQPPDRMTVNHLPLLSCKGNTAFASALGMVIRFHTPPVTKSVVEDCTIWRTGTGARIVYSDNVHLRSLRLIGDGKGAQTGISQASEGIGGTVYENLHVEGWATGLAISDIVGKSQVIQGGHYDNQVNIALALAYVREGSGRVDEIKGPIRFRPTSRRDIALTVNYDAFYTRDPNVLFSPHVVRIDTEKCSRQQLYFTDQRADYVPLPREARGKFRSSAKGHVPDELIGKSNRELWQKYGLAIAGVVAPAGARTEPKIEGLLGEPSTYRQALVLHNVFSPQLEGYRPICTEPGQVKKATPAGVAVDLQRGWNLVTQKRDDQVWSFLVFGGEQPRGMDKKAKYGKAEGDKAKTPPKRNTKPEP